MKKIITVFLLILMCFSLTSCAIVDAFDALKHSISGEIIDPVDGFSVGEEKGVLIYKENKYIIVEEINGDCEFDIADEDILLGQTSNFPFFPNFSYYASSHESPVFIMGGSTSRDTATFVYLKEDVYNNDLVYVLQNTNYEFEISSTFIKTDKVDYDNHIMKDKFTKVVRVEFFMKDIPRIRAVRRIYLIDNIWYCVEQDVSYELSDEFVSELIKRGVVE